HFLPVPDPFVRSTLLQIILLEQLPGAVPKLLAIICCDGMDVVVDGALTSKSAILDFSIFKLQTRYDYKISSMPLLVSSY
uniref:Uncharacterized protein n=1 Tax=Romanomermis culicivorax TaxID=13658 RepID=A0A915HRF7_ROMCU